MADTEVRAGRRKVRISNPDKVLFPADGITKLDLAEYYAAVAPAMAPHTRDRPLNLWRWNRGIDHEVVIQQAIPKGAPDWVRRVTGPRRRGGGVEEAAASGVGGWRAGGGGGGTSSTRWVASRRRSSGWRTRTASRRMSGRHAAT